MAREKNAESSKEVKSLTESWDERRAEIEASFREMIDTDGIYRLAAASMLEAEELAKGVREYKEMLNQSHQLLAVLRTNLNTVSDEQKLAIAELFDSAKNMAVEALKHGIAITQRRAKKVNAKGGQDRWERDPKTKEKSFVKARWAEWQVAPHLHANKTAFAKKMLDHCTYLTSEKHITDLCRKWEKQ